MPLFEIAYHRLDKERKPVPDGKALVTRGPILDVVVSVPPPLARSMQESQKHVPDPVSGIALIDTGATKTSIDNDVIFSLGIPPIGRASLGMAGGLHEATLHVVQIAFPAMGNLSVVLPHAISCSLSGVIVPGGGKLSVLFGRDLLQHFVMIYNGPAGRVSVIPV